MNHSDTFKAIYEYNGWGEDICNDFPGQSGEGSSIEFNKDYIAFLKRFIEQQGIKSVVDVGCGDWRCGKFIYYKTDVKYTGYDCYAGVINSHNKHYKPLSRFWTFEVKNCLLETDTMEGADLLIVKDVLQHWLDDEVTHFLDKVLSSGKYKYILSINCDCDENSTESLGFVGGWRRLGASHKILQKYGFISVFKYQTKSVCLVKC